MIVKLTMISAIGLIENRKNSHELLGFDFMVDENFNVWLIEVNSSPAMDYSSQVTERMVQTMLYKLLTVVLDYEKASLRKKS